MTYKEYMDKYHPEQVSSTQPGGVCGCPGDHFPEYTAPPYGCDSFRSCTECWNQEMPIDPARQEIMDRYADPDGHIYCHRCPIFRDTGEYCRIYHSVHTEEDCAEVIRQLLS